jgi:hypothetical protein
MLDVHPPHSSPHTWKDFFIHIATISVGLLIAVGLEQTVEAIHRAQERRALIAAYRAECEENLKLIDNNVDAEQSGVTYFRAAIVALRDATPQAGFVTVTLPTRVSTARLHSPSRAVWTAAKASGKVELLEDSLAQVYDRVDFEAVQCEEALTPINKARLRLVYFGIRHHLDIKPGDTVRLTLAQRDESMDLLSDLAMAASSRGSWAAEWKGATHAVLDGVVKRDAMFPYIDQAVAAARPK